MSTRIEIELTSAGAEGQWTWRAAGAREPRGTVDGSLLPAGVSVGDQLKAETEQDLDGIHIVSIVVAKDRAERDGRLELLPSNERFEPVVEVRATRDRHDSGHGRPRRDRDDRGDRGDRGPRGERRDRDRDRPRDSAGRSERPAPTERRGGPRREAEPGDDRRRQRPHFTPPPEIPQRPKPKRLRPGKQHLAEVLAALPEEQRPVAELALQGLAAVRQRIREDNARLKAEDKPPMPEATVLKMAEDLLPRLRVAEWLDRADAAKRQLAHLDLRDLRSVVAASDDPVVVRDEATRELAAELKVALATKQDEELNLWRSDVETATEVGRVVRALKLSAVPPKAGVPFPHALGTKLAELTNASLTPDDPPDRWIAVLEAAAFSPVRALVAPAQVPAQVSDDLRATVTRLGPLLPQVAALFGIEVSAKAPMPKPLRLPPRKKEAARPAPSGNVATHPGPKRTRRSAPPTAASEQPSDAEPVSVADDAPGAQPPSPPAKAPALDETPAVEETTVDAVEEMPTVEETAPVDEAPAVEPAAPVGATTRDADAAVGVDGAAGGESELAADAAEVATFAE